MTFLNKKAVAVYLVFNLATFVLTMTSKEEFNIMNEIELKEWHKIGDKLTNYFGICRCQRKLKSIIDNLYSIYIKCDYEDPNRDFTGAEWLVIAMIDRYGKEEITHGINCEYPIINKESEFWKWIIEVKDSSYLSDN